MKLSERIQLFEMMFEDLMETNSINEKRHIVKSLRPELTDDFMAIISVLVGNPAYGYKIDINQTRRSVWGDVLENDTVEDVLMYLYEPKLHHDLSRDNIELHLCKYAKYLWFFAKIINRELRLGIGPSILGTTEFSPMLAKKYEDKLGVSSTGYFITEKLDGNRCIAYHDGENWRFVSRNGKIMHVKFDMSGLNPRYCYDGEVLSREQVTMSEAIANHVTGERYDVSFNSTSGAINRHSGHKNLVYNIFDVMLDDETYWGRRMILENMTPKSDDVRILPLLAHYENHKSLRNNINDLLEYVVSVGGEGLMINVGDATYKHKRTNDILKVKKVNTMDMRVIGIEEGKFKYEGAVGSLMCEALDKETGKRYSCEVGTGLSDEQRFYWFARPSDIVGKIVEVAYFDVSQSKDVAGSNYYSLRFPRLKKVRSDKSDTSVH